MMRPRLEHDAAGRRILIAGKPLPPLPETSGADVADWIQAKPIEIQGALDRASKLPSGGWFVAAPSRNVTERPTSFFVDGRELVAWRHEDIVRIAPNSCPHMGAPLSAGRVHQGRLVCPWHGLELGEKRHGKWEPFEAYDDGVLTWVRFEKDPAVPKPILPTRPSHFVDGVIQIVARCEPRDVIANRLDPWHGAHFHPHSFARLKVIGLEDDVLSVRVAFRVAGPLCVEVDCTFHAPEPRTIVMTIIDGDGAGSVVETHATPIAPARTTITEATLATSDRRGFHAAIRSATLLRPLIKRSARRLWVEDAAYAERSYFLRNGQDPTPWVDRGGATPGAPQR